MQVTVKDSIENIRQQFNLEIAKCSSAKEVEALKVSYLGKKGLVQELLKGLKEVPVSEKPHVGKLVNDLKTALEQRIDSASTAFSLSEENNRLISEAIDTTLPGRKKLKGSKHLITHVIDEMLEIFVSMGFSVQGAPILKANTTISTS